MSDLKQRHECATSQSPAVPGKKVGRTSACMILAVAMDKHHKRAITSTTGAGRSLLRGPGRLVALKTSTMPPMIRTYGLKARASAPSIAMLVTAGLAVMSAAATTGVGGGYLVDC